MMNYIKEALADENKEQVVQKEYVKEQQLLNGARAFAFVNAYHQERTAKQAYINEHVVAQGHDI
jgi:hypothetical protein